jgi:hypothetical protein
MQTTEQQPLVVQREPSEVRIPRRPALRLGRADLMDQIVCDARREAKQLKVEADNKLRQAAQQFVDEVSRQALIVARPIISALRKVCGEHANHNYRADFSFREGHFNRDWDKMVVTPGDTVYEIEVHNGGEGGYGRSKTVSFRVSVTLTPKMAVLRDAAIAALSHRKALEQFDRPLQEQRADAARKVVRMALEETDEGVSLLAAMRKLREAVEKKTGKNILLEVESV